MKLAFVILSVGHVTSFTFLPYHFSSFCSLPCTSYCSKRSTALFYSNDQAADPLSRAFVQLLTTNSLGLHRWHSISISYPDLFLFALTTIFRIVALLLFPSHSLLHFRLPCSFFFSMLTTSEVLLEGHQAHFSMLKSVFSPRILTPHSLNS